MQAAGLAETLVQYLATKLQGLIPQVAGILMLTAARTWNPRLGQGH